MEYGIVWLLFAIGAGFLLIFVTGRFGKIRKVQKEAMAQRQRDMEKYRHLSSEVFDETPTEKLAHAVLYHIQAKEDRIYESETIDKELFDVLTEGEKMIYTIAQLETAMNGGRGSIHTFFIDDLYAPCRPYVEPAFTNVNCFEIVELMKAAERLAEIIDLDLEDEENDIEGDYASYNFADFTHELLNQLKSSGILDKAGKYIREHKELFVETKEVTEIGSEEDEGTSTEV